MPRVTEVHRQARRDEIAEAALRVLQRNGVSETSIAQIVEESGLSAGAIYVNFDNKAELMAALLSTEQLESGRCIMIGDRAQDMHAANAHKVGTIGVLWGYGSRQELVDAGARTLINLPDEILVAAA